MLEWKWNEIGENRMNRLGRVRKSRFLRTIENSEKTKPYNFCFLDLDILEFWTFDSVWAKDSDEKKYVNLVT